MKSMKSVIFAVCAAALMSIAAVAPAAAAEHDCSFVADNNKVYSISDKITLEQQPGYVLLKQASGTVEWFPDATGATWNKIVASQCFQKTYATSSPTKRFNTAVATSINCFTSGTVVGYQNLGGENYADGCAGHANAKAKAN